MRIKNFFKIALIILHFSSVTAQQVYKTMKRLPDTGQSKSYTTTPGEDNDFIINPPTFIINGDGIITDTITGLQWQQADGGEMTYVNAIIYCDSLTLGGYTNWRLPDCHELFSILNHDKANPAMDATYFTTSTAEYWWSSQQQVNDTTKIWVTNAGGGVGNHPKNETISSGGTKRFHVKAVRDITTPALIPEHFTNNGNGTITDNLTGLIWSSSIYTDTVSWENALTISDTISISGYNDWRLPNIKELQSINDENFINPSVNKNYFTEMTPSNFWSSTTLPNQATKAWYLDTHYGITTYQLKTSRMHFLLVRGGNLNTSLTEEFALNSIDVYPNPINEYFTVNFNKNRIPLKMTLYDMRGKVVFTIDQIPVQSNLTTYIHLPSGLYLLEVHYPDNTKLYKKVSKLDEK